jgi:hypothetical protein
MSPVQEKLEFVMDQAAKFLAPEGFRRSGKYFRKPLPEGGVRWSIWSQKHRRSTADEIRFTFEAAAEWKKRLASYEDDVPRTAWYPGVGCRIGFLTPQQNDTWWEIDEKTSADFLSDQLNAVFASCVLPFLKRLQTEQDIKGHLRGLADGEMRRNYDHAITLLEFDLEEKKPASEIEERISRIRFLGRLHFLKGEVIETKIERVLKAYGYDQRLSSKPEKKAWWKL